MALTEKEDIRWHALADICLALHYLNNSTGGMTFAREGNQYISEKKKLKIRREREIIIEQLNNRFTKLDMKIGR